MNEKEKARLINNDIIGERGDGESKRASTADNVGAFAARALWYLIIIAVWVIGLSITFRVAAWIITGR